MDALPPDLFYFAAIRSTTRVLMEPPLEGSGMQPCQGSRPHQAQSRRKSPDRGRDAKTTSFTPLSLKEGSKSPLGASLCALRVFPVLDAKGGSSRAEWLILLKTPEGETKFAVSNAPETASLETFGVVSTLRWSIEQFFSKTSPIWA